MRWRKRRRRGRREREEEVQVATKLLTLGRFAVSPNGSEATERLAGEKKSFGEQRCAASPTTPI